MENSTKEIQEPIVASGLAQGLKNYIIGKLWITNVSGNKPGAIRISRNLPSDLVLKAGSTLFLNQNTKREGKQDADFSVSVLLPTELADKLIQTQKLAISG